MHKAKAGDDKIISEAKKRFAYCVEWEADFRASYKRDLMFANADPDNNWQWPDMLYANRVVNQSPTLTINKVRQHNLQIINDAKQNKPGVQIHPVGDEASYEAAQIFEDIVRHIEYISNAEQAYDTATTFQVQGGYGVWRVCTDYMGETTFDQEIFIKRIKDPLSVYIDPDINEFDGSDANYGFVFTDYPKDEFEKLYPDCIDWQNTTFDSGDTWVQKDHVRVAEYFRRKKEVDTLIAYIDPQTGERKFMRKSKMPPELIAALKETPEDEYSERELVTDKIEVFKIAGNCIVERSVWAGRYIPLVRVIGEETIIDGKLDRKGHTRAMKDAQRMYNYWTSSATEQVALQTKSPFIAPIEAVGPYMDYWSKANTENFSVLPYKAIGEDGNPIPAPARAAPPAMASAYIQGMQIAQNEMMMSSGQYQAQMGENENAKSGVAINARQRQGDRATYHYIDGLAVAIRFTGKILIDLIPKIYDTPRVLRIRGQDGATKEVNLEPDLPVAAQKVGSDQNANAVAYAFNPSVGKYEVVSDVGPGFATKRQEAFNAFQQIVTADNGLMPIVGDLLFKNADFPGANELANRLRRGIPPQFLEDGPSPQQQQLMQQVQQLQSVIENLVKELGDKTAEIQNKENETEIRAYDAESKRITSLANAVPELGIDSVKNIVKATLAELGSEATPQREGATASDMARETD